jgi:N-acetylmuramoyl-L-alanine amidase|tara:strand:- start:6298 stop:6741 length:444 start_codon:yes stop_codon:yes gene_type:complete
MELRKKTEMIVVHCAATKPSMDIGYKEIRKWHVEDNGWDDVGYHYIIKRDGTVEVARAEAFQGAHAPAVNSKSIAICLVGGMAEDGGAENNFTLEQFLSLKDLIKKIKMTNPNIVEVVGHCDVQDNKPNCPGFNLKEWLIKEDINVA